MEFARTAAEDAFADEVRTWLEAHLGGANSDLRGRGGVGQEDVEPKRLLEWERELATGGWLGLDYPVHLGRLLYQSDAADHPLPLTHVCWLVCSQ